METLRPVTSSARQPNWRSAVSLKSRISPASSITIIASGTVLRIEVTAGG